MVSVIKYELVDCPDNLQPGRHAVRVGDNTRWEGNNLVIECIYDGLYNEDNPSLISLVKEADDGK